MSVAKIIYGKNLRGTSLQKGSRNLKFTALNLFLTAANRDRLKNTSATLELNEDTSEEEIRNSLISELSQLKDQK